LRQVNIFRPGDVVFPIRAQLLTTEMRAEAGDTAVVQDCLQLASLIFGEAPNQRNRRASRVRCSGTPSVPMF
jgi:hypothetical protein